MNAKRVLISAAATNDDAVLDIREGVQVAGLHRKRPTTARLKLMTRAPRSCLTTAVASCCCCAWHTFNANARVGENRRIRIVQSGQIAGAAEFRFAARTPVTNVPCMHAAPLAVAQVLLWRADTSRSRSWFKSGCCMKTGPSITPTLTSGRPHERSINGVSLTNASESTQ